MRFEGSFALILSQSSWWWSICFVRAGDGDGLGDGGREGKRIRIEIPTFREVSRAIVDMDILHSLLRDSVLCCSSASRFLGVLLGYEYLSTS